ncbi:hypothetical protein SprV_0301143200 [Sparganum proliferum]
MARQLHDGMMVRVTDNGATSEAFAVTSGVKQGCELTPTLLSFMFSATLISARDPHRLQDQRAPSQQPVNAGPDACLHNYYPRSNLQRILRTQQPTINTDRTAIMHQQQPTAEYSVLRIRVDSIELKHNVSLHQNRRRSGQSDLESQSRLRPAAEHRVESPRAPTEYQNEDPPPTCPHCKRVFRARISLVGHLRTQCAINLTTSTSYPALDPAANPAPTAIPVAADHTVVAPPLPSALPPTPALTAAASITTTTTSRTPPTDRTMSDVPSPCIITTDAPTFSDVGSVPAWPHCDLTFIPNISAW